MVLRHCVSDNLAISLVCCYCCCQVASVVSDSVRPHRRQPTRLPHPWDSPGKNTGMGCHFLLQCMKVKSESEVAQSCLTLPNPMDCSLPGFSVHGIFQARVLEWVAIAFSAICQQIWKIQQWPQDWERSAFIAIPKKDNAKECSYYHTIAVNSHAGTEKAMAPHSSTLAWKIPWTEEPGRLQSMGLGRVGHD